MNWWSVFKQVANSHTKRTKEMCVTVLSKANKSSEERKKNSDRSDRKRIWRKLQNCSNSRTLDWLNNFIALAFVFIQWRAFFPFLPHSNTIRLLIFGILIILSHHSGLISFSLDGSGPLVLKCGNLPSQRIIRYIESIDRNGFAYFSAVLWTNTYTTLQIILVFSLRLLLQAKNITFLDSFGLKLNSFNEYTH